MKQPTCDRCNAKIRFSVEQLFRIRSPEAKDRAYGEYIKCPKCGMPTKLRPP